jgi:hypothetical protein
VWTSCKCAYCNRQCDALRDVKENTHRKFVSSYLR